MNTMNEHLFIVGRDSSKIILQPEALKSELLITIEDVMEEKYD